MEKQLIIIILAGGNGTRMNSSLHSHALLEYVGGIPMVVRVINESAKLLPRKLFVIVNQNELKIREAVRNFGITENVEFINQGPSLGTGYAIQTCRDRLKKYNNAETLIVPGNMSLITQKIMEQVVKDKGDIKVPYIEKDDAGDETRLKIVKDKFNKIIVREECCAKDLCIKNACIGMYCIDNVLLCSNINFITTLFTTNQQHIEEVINIIKKREHVFINLIKLPLLNHIQVKSIKTKSDLNEINNYVSALSLI